MCFFDSPVGRCEAVGELVLLDETQQECACEHSCPPGFDCPLKGIFTEQSGVTDPASLPCRRAPPPRGPQVRGTRLGQAAQPRSEAFVLT